MSNGKRPRGRPRGTGKNDAPYLAQVADILIRDRSLKATTAMKRVMMRSTWPETDETLIRRWQVKWQREKNSFLDAARSRAQPRRTLRNLIAAVERGQLTELERREIAQLSQTIAETINKAFHVPPGFVDSLDRFKRSFKVPPPSFLDSIKALKIVELSPAYAEAVKALTTVPRAYAEAMKALTTVPRAYAEAMKALTTVPPVCAEAVKALTTVPPAYAEVMKNLATAPPAYAEAMKAIKALKIAP